MKVVHLTPPLEHLGNGVMTAAVDLALEQAAQGDEVIVCASRGNLSEEVRSRGAQICDLDVEFSARSMLRAIAQLRRVVVEFGPDVVHVHTVRGTILAAAALRMVKKRTPIVVSAHNGFSFRAFPFSMASVVVCVSEADAEVFRSLRIFRVVTVRNGALGGLRIESNSDVRLEKPAIVFVGGLYYRKGVDILIDAFALIPKSRGASLYLVGDGPDRADFEERVRELEACDQIHFLGFAPNPKAYMSAADIFVLPSRTEPFGLVLAEAREAGAAIVATSTGGIPEVLEGGRAGLLVPPEQSRALANAILMLIDDKEYRTALQEEAQRNLDWLSVARMADEMRLVYRKAARRPKAVRRGNS